MAKLSDSMTNISKLLGNLGPADKSTNFILEQRNLMRAQAQEDREIRDQIQEKIVDGLEYVRVKENIAQTKARVNKLLYDSDDSQNSEKSVDESKKKNSKTDEVDTEENSQKLYERHMENEKRIKGVIKQMRGDAREYLGVSEY